eukprot:988597-Rhodomonas_salina.1
MCCVSVEKEQLSLPEALDTPDAERWWKSVQEEMESWRALEVYEEVNLQRGVRAIDSKFVFK